MKLFSREHNFLVSVISQGVNAILLVIRKLFVSDNDLMSEEVRKILSNPDDAKKYVEGLKELQKGEKKEVTLTLSDKTEMTLVL